MSLEFSRPQQFILTSTQKVKLFLSGVGGGKTHLIGVDSGHLIERFPDVPGFIGANTYMQLSQSTLFRVQTVWREVYGWIEGEDYVIDKKPPRGFDTSRHAFKSYAGIVSFKNGAIVFVGSLDNAKAHDGKEFGWAFLDETKDSKEEDVKDIILARLRSVGIYIDNITGQLTNEEIDDNFEYNKAHTPLSIMTSPAKVQWINEWFNIDKFQDEILTLIFDKENFFKKEYDDKCVVISSTYHNEKNLPPGYIQGLLDNYTDEKAKMLIYGNPFVRSGGEFYSSFERKRHVAASVKFKPWLPVHLSLDQNVNPYITGVLYQIEEVYDLEGNLKFTQITLFDEICLENPRNKTKELCKEFALRWGDLVDGLYYYGDPSGRKGDTRGDEHDYDIIESQLRAYLHNGSDRVPYKHPRILQRKDFANEIFDNKHNLRIKIAPHCKKSIADFEFLKEDKNGKKLKELTTDKTTGKKYEKYGHTSDAHDYFICEAFEREYEFSKREAL